MITFLAKAAHFLVFELYKKINYWSKACLMTTEWRNREADTLKRDFIYFMKKPSKLFLPHTAENTIKGPNFSYSPKLFLISGQWWTHTAEFCFCEICFSYSIHFSIDSFILLTCYYHRACCIYWVVYVNRTH